jgi:hypothetical protein
MSQRPVRSVEVLPCILTDDEKIAKSQEMCSALSKVDSLELDLEGIKKRYKSDMETYEKIALDLRQQVSTGKQYKEVECSIVWDFDKKKKIYVRNDTGEVVHDVPISEYELQEYNSELAAEEERLAAEKEENDAITNGEGNADPEEVSSLPGEGNEA